MAAVLLFMCVGMMARSVSTVPFWKIEQGNSGAVESWTEDGNLYKGAKKYGLIDGIGSCDYTNGEHYEGEWKAGKRERTGTYYSVNGDRYEGEVKAGRMEGTGTYYFADGSYCSGEWKDDILYNEM